MPHDLEKTIKLSSKEIEEYLNWAKGLQKSHSSECGAPLASLSITFEISNLGTSVIAHTGNCTSSESHIVLRD